ncbi:NAD(P)H-dependent glycerol-3-phosphate dehydrogenase [Roseofilum casamattae]|uniref:Glycerol-3-phosphate dehydrogenase [NAD(P)+] n=1 Tax=Roseofilum casamattae BLCC-M143 TaxID=3022442 RepID=A0ABT7BWU3_9CYAN|nr:NAD(P)H-dependent glycerol-3-phosphate dehydrogenase [Roseofilum casamattae]MDJ1182931.1 NAD(P)H-dependent glycerol-3-phosphate dehydrogenase [Roseofilum casamattae BLCC-M143]
MTSALSNTSDTPLEIAIIGGGVWGQTLAELARDRGHNVRIWSRRGTLPLDRALAGAAITVSAVSMKGVKPVLERAIATGLAPETILVTVTKGLDPSDRITPSRLWQAAFPEHSVVVLAGPNLSKEINRGLPAATTVASTNPQAAQFVQQAFSSNRFRVYTNDDPLGVELGGTLKNVLAIAAGACDGLDLGTNAKAGLLTRGLAEIIRIGIHWGAKPETFYGLSGLGDLLATCNSTLSRNYQVGYQLAQGKPLDKILRDLEGTAEGVNTTQVLVPLANEHHIPIPICSQVDLLLQGKITARQAVGALMLRDVKPESGF